MRLKKHSVSFWLNDDEFQALRVLAQRESRNRSDWLRLRLWREAFAADLRFAGVHSSQGRPSAGNLLSRVSG